MHFRSSLLLLLSHQAAGRWMARTAAMPPNLTCSGLTSTRFASVVGLWLPGATFQGHDVHVYVLRRQCLQDSKRRQKGKRLARNATRPESLKEANQLRTGFPCLKDWRRSVWSLRTSGPRCLCPTRAGRPLERSLHVVFRVTIIKSRYLLPTYLPACLPACLPTCLPTYLPTPARLPACLPTYPPTYTNLDSSLTPQALSLKPATCRPARTDEPDHISCRAGAPTPALGVC